MAASAATLAGRRALVTGATSGIGQATALRLARAGATVLATGRDAEALDLLLKEAERLGVAMTARPAVFPRHDDLAGLVDAVRSEPGGLSILVHCAGLYASGPFADAPGTDLEDLFAVNVMAPWWLTRALLPDLRSAGGDIVFVNSTQGLRATTGASQYAATKQALRALADSLRDELADSDLRVCTIYPGRTATRMQEEIFQKEGRAWDPHALLQPDDVAEIIALAVSLPGDASLADLVIRPSRPLQTRTRL